ALGAAIRYAAVDKDVVIVAAAGNSGAGGSGSGGTCESNPLTDLSHPDDPRNWAGVTSVSIPSLWQPYVLSVASLTAGGQPSKFTMAGPWVGIAAPGENIVSVSNADGGGLANGLPNQRQQLTPLSGTSYAAGYVSGVAALVRSNYPELTAAQVMHRLTATAHNGARDPSNVVEPEFWTSGGADLGAAAPTGVLRRWHRKAGVSSAAPQPRNTTPRNVAFAGAPP
ncbi:subtilase family protein, partial [Mycobacterium ulcerans str. Harvey]